MCLYFCFQVDSNQPWPGSLRAGSVEVGHGAGLGCVEFSWSRGKVISRAFIFAVSCTCEHESACEGPLGWPLEP